MSTLSAIATRYAEAVRWLAACPFTDGQPFYETADREMREMGEAMLETAKHPTHDPAIHESIEAALVEGEFGDFDDEAAFWDYIANWSE